MHRGTLKFVISCMLIFGANMVLIQAASATVSLIKPTDAAQEITKSKTIPATLPAESQSRAPEPATMALFGSGIIGMIVSFVRKTYAAAKRAIDIIGSTIGIILSIPFFVFAAIFIKLMSRGPIFFKQIRVGKNGKLFEIYKFRTMRVDAEKETGPIWAAKNDNRLIPGGAFLRKTRIDELPQFINVIKGDMSLIGPRPERPFFVEKFKQEIPDYEKRLVVKPGITGLAQVWHKYDETIEDVHKKIKYDLLYIRKMCLWTDIRIVFNTIRVVLTGHGAQ